MDEQKKAALIAKFAEIERRDHKRYLDAVVAEIVERTKNKCPAAVLN
jgi:hypothetical protein